MQAINDITELNRILVASVARPACTTEVATLMRGTDMPVSIGGGYFSMGSQTASPGTLHLDLSRMNRVLRLEPVAARMRIQAAVSAGAMCSASSIRTVSPSRSCKRTRTSRWVAHCR
ncbi:Oxidoreductase, FAD-binding [Candidatus Paraburkholderia calva]|nr:Oxidoreductase, FAD-binding [Candidatus Paraburkholderia calva]